MEKAKPKRRVYAPPANPFALKRLELFGEQVHPRRIQFEWPTSTIFELMPEKEGLRITQLVLQANESHQLISVQCTLSNGMKSPTLKSLMSDTPTDKLAEKTIDFTDEQTVHTIAA